MINANELRIGNLINEKVLGKVKILEIHTKVVIVEAINLTVNKEKISQQYTLSLNHIEPIKLSEDILLNLGAIKKPKFNCFPSFNLKGLQINYINDMWIEYVSQVEITGLHHLQNIFYFRMNEELSVVANGS